LTQRYLNREEVFCGPKEDDEVAKRVLRRMKVVNSLDVKALGCSNVLEDFPVSTGGTDDCQHWPLRVIRTNLRALKQCDKEAREI
jgi:hypothetical protein